MGKGDVFKQAPGNVANVVELHAIVRVTDYERKCGQMLVKSHNHHGWVNQIRRLTSDLAYDETTCRTTRVRDYDGDNCGQHTLKTGSPFAMTAQSRGFQH